MWGNFRPYVSVAQRRAKADRKLKQLAKQGQQTSPVQIAGRKIATTFWGQAWCDNLEAYSDFSNRLPRGRTYVRNGSVIDLQIQPGRITAMVSGSDLYNIDIELAPLVKDVWKQVKSQCAGRIGSLVDLLQGKLSKDVMSIVTAHDAGLFPKPKEIKMKCSCPDYAFLCKHLAAVLYGIGARLDQQPELLFVLRQVDHLELVAAAGQQAATAKSPSKGKALADDALSEIFGIELESSASDPAEASAKPAKPRGVKSQAHGKLAPRPSPRKSAARTVETQGAEPPATKPKAVKPRAKKASGRTQIADKPQKLNKSRAAAKPTKRLLKNAAAGLPAAISPPEKRASGTRPKKRRRSDE